MRFPLIVTTGLVAAFCAAPIAAFAPSASATPTPSYGATWTVDTVTNALTEYAPSASGAAAAIATISGASTDLSGPTAVAVGPKGNLVVTNSTGNSITEYAAGSNGDVAPTATITGSLTGLTAPNSVTIADGQIWVTDPAANLVEAFSVGSSGNVLPAETVAGAKTRLEHPIAVAVEHDFGFITVLNAPTSGKASITSYYSFRFGNIAPIARVLGAKGRPLVSPTAMVASGFDTVWVADSGSESLTNLITLENGLPALASVSGVRTGLQLPSGIALNALNQIVVADGSAHTVSVYGAKANGDAAPIRTISGVGSDAGSPASVAVTGAPPAAPTDVHATAHNGRATVHWTAPTDTGGGVVGYEVNAVSRSTINTGPGGIIIVSGGGLGRFTAKTSLTMHHLRNATRYHFRVQAINAFGDSPAAKSGFVTPLTVAAAPLNVIAVGGNKSLTVGWTKPSQNGGRPITHYRVEYATCAPGAIGCASHSRIVGAVHRRVPIHDLTTGTKYHVRVIAETSVGDGHPSKTVTATPS